MSNLNFSSTLPAAPSGSTNVAFAVDASNNISASLPITVSPYGNLTASGVTATGTATPLPPTITQGGTAGTSSYRYSVVAVLPDGSTTAGSTVGFSYGLTSTGNATLSATNYSTITWTAVTSPEGAITYSVYRTTAGGTSPTTTGKIASGLTGTTLNDTGLAGDGTTVPTVNATGLNAGVAGLVLSNVNSGYNSNIFSAAGSGGAITLCPGLPGVDPRVIAVGSVSSPPGAIYIDTPNLYLRNLAGTNAIAVTSSGIAMSSAVTGTMGGWVNYTPTVTGTGSMTISGLTITFAQYLTIGPITFLTFQVTFTTGGTAAVSVVMTLPVNSVYASTVAVSGTTSTTATTYNPLVAATASSSNSLTVYAGGNNTTSYGAASHTISGSFGYRTT